MGLDGRLNRMDENGDYAGFPRNDMRVCTRCGAVVSKAHERQHDEFHRALEQATNRSGQEG